MADALHCGNGDLLVLHFFILCASEWQKCPSPETEAIVTSCVNVIYCAMTVSPPQYLCSVLKVRTKVS